MTNEEAILQNTLTQLTAQKVSAVNKAYNEAVMQLDSEKDIFVKAKNEECDQAIALLRQAKEEAIIEKDKEIALRKEGLKSEIAVEVDKKYQSMEASIKSALEVAKANI